MDAPCGIELDSNVDIERDGDDEEEDQQEEDEEGEDEEEWDVEEEDEHEHDDIEPRTIGQGAMVNPAAGDGCTMVDDQPIVLPEHGHILWRLRHGHIPRSVAHNQELRRLIPSVA